MRNWHVDTTQNRDLEYALEEVENRGGIVHAIIGTKPPYGIVWYEPEELEYVEIQVEFSTSKDVESFSVRRAYETVDAVSYTIKSQILDGWQLVSKAYDKGFAYLTFSRPARIPNGGSEM